MSNSASYSVLSFQIPRKLLLVVSFILVGLLIFEVWLVNRLSTYGDKIYELKHAQEALELENKILESKVAKASSLLVAEKKAKQLGFDYVNKLEYIKDDPSFLKDDHW